MSQAQNGCRLLAYGDSFIYYWKADPPNGSGPYPTTFVEGVGPMLEAMTLGQFRIDAANIFGIPGASTAALDSGYSTYVTPNLANFDILWFHGCPPDGMTVLSDATSAAANMQSVCNKALADGKIVFFQEPNPPRGTSSVPVGFPADHLYAEVNQLMKVFCYSTPGVYYLENYRQWVDPSRTDWVAAGGILKDGINAGDLGSLNAAQRFIQMVGSAFVQRPLSQSEVDSYDATYHPSGNVLGTVGVGVPQMAGTGGSISNATGGVATDFALTVSSATDTAHIVAGQEASVAGLDSSGGYRQTISVSTLLAAEFITLTLNQSGNIAGLEGHTLEASVEVEMSNMFNNTSCHLSLIATDGTTVNVGGSLYNGTAAVIAWPDGKYLLRTTPVPYASGFNIIQWQLNMSFGVGGSGVFKIGNPVVRVVS